MVLFGCYCTTEVFLLAHTGALQVRLLLFIIKVMLKHCQKAFLNIISGLKKMACQIKTGVMLNQ